MTFTDEQMQEFDAAQALAQGEPDWTVYSDVPDEYAHLTPSEQAEAVDADNMEEAIEYFERAQREYHEWWD